VTSRSLVVDLDADLGESIRINSTGPSWAFGGSR